MSTHQAHEVTVSIAASSLSTLISLGASLYALHAFESSNRTGVPLVAYASSSLSGIQTVSWTEEYHAIVSRTLLSDGVSNAAQRKIAIGAAGAARLGETVSVNDSLQLSVTGGGVDGAIAFRNSVAGPITCGLAYGPDFRPACALTAVHGLEVVVAPAQSVFLMFSTSPFELGAWMEQSSGDGLLVDMTGAASRAVTFDLSLPGLWAEADQPWAQAAPSGADLASLLRIAPQPNVLRSFAAP